MEQMVASCIDLQGVIPCHDTLDDAQQSVCRGFFDRHKHDVGLLGVAERMGIIHYTGTRETEQDPTNPKENYAK